MKQIIITCLSSFICFGVLAQKTHKEPSSIDDYSSFIGKVGNNNIITVIQAQGPVTYNLNKANGIDSFIQYLYTLPTLQSQLQQIFRVVKETKNDVRHEKNDIDKITKYTKRIDSIVNANTSLLIAIANHSVNNGIFDSLRFAQEIGKYEEENKQLKQENEELRKLTTNADFDSVLVIANKRLDEYDHAGYQQILEDFKKNQSSKIAESKDVIGKTYYLQAKNSAHNFDFDKALIQIREANKYSDSNKTYVLFEAQILAELYLYNDCILLYSHLIEVSDDDSLIMTYTFEKAMAYFQMGKYHDAIKGFSENIKQAEIFYGKKSIAICSIYNLLGQAYCNLYQFNEALIAYKNALSILEGNYIENQGQIGVIYHNIGGVYLHMAKKDEFLDKKNCALLDTALEYYEKGQIIAGIAYGDMSDKMLASYSNIGLVHKERCEYDLALRNFMYAFFIFCKTHKHRMSFELIGILNNMGLVFNRRKDYKAALHCYNGSLIIAENMFPDGHPMLATLNNNIAVVYEKLNNVKKANLHLKRAYETAKKTIGKNHFETKFLRKALRKGRISRVNKLFIKPQEPSNSKDSSESSFKVVEFNIDNFIR